MHEIIFVFSSFSFDDVKHYLQRHLTEVEQSNIIEETDKTELYSLYINCLEVCMSSFSPTYFTAYSYSSLQLSFIFDDNDDGLVSGEAMFETAIFNLCIF